MQITYTLTSSIYDTITKSVTYTWIYRVNQTYSTVPKYESFTGTETQLQSYLQSL